MKAHKVALAIITAAAVFGLEYLLGAFYSLSFDIRDWTDLTRFSVVLMFAAHLALYPAFFGDA